MAGPDKKAEAPKSEAPKLEKPTKVVAKSSFVHGRGNERLTFDKGDEIRGLSDAEIMSFLANGLIEKI